MKTLIFMLTLLAATSSFASKNNFCIGIVVEPGYWLNNYFLTCGDIDSGVIESDFNLREEGTQEFKESTRELIEADYSMQYIGEAGNLDVFSSSKEPEGEYCILMVSNSELKRKSQSILQCKDSVLETITSSSADILIDHLEKESFVKVGKVGKLYPYGTVFSQILIFKRLE